MKTLVSQMPVASCASRDDPWEGASALLVNNLTLEPFVFRNPGRGAL